MHTWLANAWCLSCKFAKFGAAAVVLTLLGAASALADEPGGEGNLKLPDLSQVTFLGLDGHKLLFFVIVICIFGIRFPARKPISHLQHAAASWHEHWHDAH